MVSTKISDYRVSGGRVFKLNADSPKATSVYTFSIMAVFERYIKEIKNIDRHSQNYTNAHYAE